ncbi:class I SAM-dependent methyltransferase [Trichothermofontia sichuanensis B231]|uniref:class I SAM-dependent methyltransferase n=1 Tax=Trichothermofontia sichuanensis TaxID=3045816 RepID=UPI002247BE6F|nr:class I SAM-dependent methyltransferase [Trichothermofontia sichuanensis]UZQ55315.1 class I SAM-dependent methyltransferase [Trichothermofontia sichuanensis B231]
MINIYQENHNLYASANQAPDFDQDRAKLLGKWLKDIPIPSRSLDIGCANGGFSNLLPTSTEKWGLDFQHHPSLPASFNFISVDIAEYWPVPDLYFDIVLAGEVIEHVLDTDLFLNQCYRVLKPGGHLLLTTPNLVSFANLRYWVQADQYMWVDSGASQFGHVRYLAPKRMELALRKAGFYEILMASSSGLESLSKIPYLRTWLQKLFPLRGNRLCVRAQKPLQ